MALLRRSVWSFTVEYAQIHVCATIEPNPIRSLGLLYTEQQQFGADWNQRWRKLRYFGYVCGLTRSHE